MIYFFHRLGPLVRQCERLGRWQLALIVGATGGVTGCVNSTQHGPGFMLKAPAAERVPALAHDLAALAQSSGTGDEAARVAEVAVATAAKLRTQWRPVRPALLNNVLVNMGYRERGLCYQWTNDMLEPLEALGLAHYDLHWGTSHWGDNLKEHNAVIITAQGRPFAEGLVLDAWRASGRLVWVLVRDDTKYPWRELTPAELAEFRPGVRLLNR